MSAHLTSEDLDLLHLDALPEARAERVGEHLRSCAQCQAEKARVDEGAAKFGQYVLPRSLESVRVRGSQSWVRRWMPERRWVAAMAVALVAVVIGFRVARVTDEGYVGVRGNATWTVVAARGEVQRRLTNGDTLREGDRLRFVVEPGNASHLLILSVDGAGQRTVYFPPGSDHSAKIGAGRQELPGSIELDATAGRERLYAIFSHQPLDAAEAFERLATDAEAFAADVEDLLKLELIKESR